jgi:iron(III) transport system substrate-binding protein
MGMIRGHVLVSAELRQIGDFERAAAHARHPLVELMPGLEVHLGPLGLDAGLRQALDQHASAVEQADTALAEARFGELDGVLERVAERAVGTERWTEASFMRPVVAALLETSAGEYGEAIENGVVVEVVEYQDAYGFYKIARAWYERGIAPGAAEFPGMQASMDEVFGIFESAMQQVQPPPTPAAAQRVQAAASQAIDLLVELGLAEGYRRPAAVPDPDPEALAGDDEIETHGRLVVYSGRSEELMKQLFEQFEQQSGVDLAVRYGDTAELAATLLEEGDNSPTDIFFAQDAGALGALAAEGRLARLPDSVLERVEPQFRSPQGVWIGTSGRARTVVYNSDELGERDLPASVWGFTEAKWQGRIGWAPTNGSFQAFVTALRKLEGDQRAREWLEGILANRPTAYRDNTAIVEAVAAGEVDVGFVNHYYVLRLAREHGTEFAARNHYLTAGDAGALINVAGVGLLVSSKNQQALGLAEFMLSAPAQRYFAERTLEYPLIDGVGADQALPPLDSIAGPKLDLSDLSDLRSTLELLQEVGVLQ